MARKSTNSNANRIQALLDLLSCEHPDIRNELASVFPAYNDLLNMHALSFEEFALLPIAKQRGLSVEDPLFSYEKVLPPCPKCSEKQAIRRLEPNTFLCGKCSFKFAANWQSISSGSKCSSVVWLKVLQCMLDFYSVRRTCDCCKISPNTFYSIRNKLFYGMMLLMDEVKLYGRIQCDNTFVRISYKGSKLNDPDYPDGSLFDEVNFIPRAARNRGGRYASKDLNQNSVCIFAAVDEVGHMITRFVGIGNANSNLLLDALGRDRLLLTVPDRDPFALFSSVKNSKQSQSKPGDASLLISDKEAAIERFARIYGIEHESHVYRRDSKQMKMSEQAGHIQTANNIHSRLKDFLRRSNYVSSRYLPGFLVFFEFIVNTGATQDAISELFCILSRPGTGRPSSYFEDLFAVPNYLLQWAKSDNPLKNFKQSQIQAFYLYSKRLEQLESGDENIISVAEIAAQCNCSTATVRRNYKNLKSAGYSDLIFWHYEGRTSKSLCTEFSSSPKKTIMAQTPTILAIYDEYAENKRKPCGERLLLKDFIPKVNEKYKTSFTRGQLAYHFKMICDRGLREPLPANNTDTRLIRPRELRALQIKRAHDEYRETQRSLGNLSVSHQEVVQALSAQYKLSFNQMQNLIYDGSKVENLLSRGKIMLREDKDSEP